MGGELGGRQGPVLRSGQLVTAWGISAHQVGPRDHAQVLRAIWLGKHISFSLEHSLLIVAHRDFVPGFWVPERQHHRSIGLYQKNTTPTTTQKNI